MATNTTLPVKSVDSRTCRTEVAVNDEIEIDGPQCEWIEFIKHKVDLRWNVHCLWLMTSDIYPAAMKCILPPLDFISCWTKRWIKDWEQQQQKVTSWFKNKHFTRFLSFRVYWVLFMQPPSNFSEWFSLQPITYNLVSFRGGVIWRYIEFGTTKSNCFSLKRHKLSVQKPGTIIQIIFPLVNVQQMALHCTWKEFNLDQISFEKHIPNWILLK